MPEHNRWASNCERFHPPAGSYTQYLVDYNRNELCEICANRTNGASDE